MFKTIKKLAVPCFLLAALLLVTAGCGQEDTGTGDQEFVSITSTEVRVGGELIADRATYDAALKEGEVILYTAQSADVEMTIADAFMRQFPGINVEIMRLPGSRLHERYLTEWEAGINDVDVIVQSEAGFFRKIADEGMLLEHTPPSSHRYPDSMKVEGFVHPLHFSPMIIVYNSELVAEEDAPKDWTCLLDPKWDGAVGHTSIGGGSPYSLFLTIQSLFGWEFFEELKKVNDPMIYPGGAGVTSGLTSGEVKVAALGVFSCYPAKVHMRAPLEFVYPESGAAPHVTVTGIAKTAPNVNAAKLYLNWYLSREGQTRISDIRGVHSYRADVIPPRGVKAYGEFPLFEHDLNKLYYDDEFRQEFILTWNRVMEFFE